MARTGPKKVARWSGDPPLRSLPARPSAGLPCKRLAEGVDYRFNCAENSGKVRT
jgi:hypothetical protein